MDLQCVFFGDVVTVDNGDFDYLFVFVERVLLKHCCNVLFMGIIGC